jgi:hypothetical protein
MNRVEAMQLLSALPVFGGSLSPCEEVNPRLLSIWSRLKGRTGGATVWSELDVAESSRLMLIRHIRISVLGTEKENL